MPGDSLFHPKRNFRRALATEISSPRSDLQINFGLRFRNLAHSGSFRRESSSYFSSEGFCVCWGGSLVLVNR